MAEPVEIVEVGPRDGLQAQSRIITLSQKVALIDALSRVGFRRIECASFVSPKWVPQMADSAEVLSQIRRATGVHYTALVPNMRGFEAAKDAQADEIAVFASASDGFSRANTNASTDETLDRFAPVCAAARTAGMPVRGYVSCLVDCPFDGPVAPHSVARVTRRLSELGCYEVSLGDTLGRGRAEAVDAALQEVLQVCEPTQLAGHFHDTGGVALGNIDVALSHGVRVFDASVGGLGGCPYAPGAPGNVATEAVHAHLTAQGYVTGLDRKALRDAVVLAASLNDLESAK